MMKRALSVLSLLILFFAVSCSDMVQEVSNPEGATGKWDKGKWDKSKWGD